MRGRDQGEDVGDLAGRVQERLWGGGLELGGMRGGEEEEVGIKMEWEEVGRGGMEGV